MGRRTATRVTALAGSVLALTLATACGGGEDQPAQAGLAAAGAAVPAADPGPPATIKQLATKTGCKKPQIQTEAEELRQAACQTDQGQYVLVTFSTDQGKTDWLTEAKKWGGNYLVGTRWVISGNDAALLQSFSATLGGTVETTS
ncbi:hypothetical protein Sru01_53100 [Sphaerisporangium rufum]|uniref:Lipoprotein n=1 Tax=Sphaerisporangium rufum TaxID=1381558 RepID=A0A919R6U2_9ACTN|nr:hypothetical protein [Sphaerisporangium rufum]GII80328.1 hypothetical protein Sru01_53100 [Sphaerisporangium rufum]